MLEGIIKSNSSKWQWKDPCDWYHLCNCSVHTNRTSRSSIQSVTPRGPQILSKIRISTNKSPTDHQNQEQKMEDHRASSWQAVFSGCLDILEFWKAHQGCGQMGGRAQSGWKLANWERVPACTSMPHPVHTAAICRTAW